LTGALTAFAEGPWTFLLPATRITFETHFESKREEIFTSEEKLTEQ
jgi:hypothetical protein